MIGEPKFKPAEQPPSEADKLKQSREFFDELKQRKGEAGAEIIRNKMAEDIPDGWVQQKLEGLADIEEAKKIALEKLHALGFLRTIEQDQDQKKIICDTEKIKREMNWRVLKELGPIYQQEHLGAGKADKTITWLADGLKVISEEDYEQGKKQAKDLVYLPKNKDDALNLEKIKAAKFYLLASDFLKKPHDYKNLRYGHLPNLQDDPQNGLDFREVMLAAKIYHPDYGDGYKDENGHIFIRDEKTREYRRLTSEYIQRHWGVLGPHEPGENFASPKLFVKKRLPNLAESGLLPPENFTVRQDQRNQEISDRPETTIKDKGQAWFNGMDHIIGAKYAKAGYKAYQLSATEGAVVGDEKNIIAVFNLFSPNENFSRTLADAKRKHYQAKLEQTNPRDFRLANIFPPLPKENHEQYQQRLNSLAGLNDVLKISDKLLNEADIRLWQDFSYKEQLLIATLANKIGQNKFSEFVHEYRRDGLRAAAALESGEQAERLLLRLAGQKDKDPKFSVRLIFRKYNEINSQEKNIQEFVRNNFNLSGRDLTPEELEKITAQYKIKCAGVLADFAGQTNLADVDKIEAKLKKISRSLKIFGASLAGLKERGVKITWPELSGMKLLSYDLGELAGIKKDEFREQYEEQVMDMVEKSYAKIFPNNSGARKKVANAFKNRFTNLENYKVNLPVLKDQAVAFATLTPIAGAPDELMAESLVVHPDAQQGSFGQAFQKQFLEREAKHHTIRAKTRADNPAIKSYEELGLKIDKDREPFMEQGVKYLWLKMEKTGNK